MAYCTAAQFIASYDSRRVRELLSDSGTPIGQPDLAANAILLQLLEEASEMVIAAISVRQKYTRDELNAMAASATEGFLLRRLVADLAYGLLQQRRGVAAGDISRLAPGYVLAQQMLGQLREGLLILPKAADETRPRTGLPSVSGDLSYQNNVNGFLTISQRTNGRMFPVD